MPKMPEKLTFWPSPILFWLMVVVTTGALAALIYFAVQWHEADQRTNKWFDDMCRTHGGTYCEHKLPSETATRTR
jgi:hypothetical protein